MAHEMTSDLWDPIIGIGTVTLVILTVVLVIGKDLSINYLRGFGRSIKKLLTIDQPSTTLTIPAPPPVYAPAFPEPPIPLDALHGRLAKYIIGNGRKLLAFHTTRGGYLVEYHRLGELVTSIETPNAETANMRWREWYLDWKSQPTGFGGTFGTGLDGELPF